MNKTILEKMHSRALRFHGEYIESGESTKENELMNLRKKFTKDYDLQYIRKNITFKNYCLGNNNQNSFCYRIEQELRGLGSARGGASDKFIVFFSNKEQKLKSGQHYPKDVNKALDIVKEDLFKIYTSAKQDKIEDIADTRFWYIIKYKIYWTYNPTHDIPIFKRDHVNKIIKNWSIDSLKDDTSRRKALFYFKNNDEVFSKMSNVEFMFFIYSPYSGLGLKEEEFDESENDTFENEAGKKIEEFKGTYTRNAKHNKLAHSLRNIIRKNADYKALNEKKRTLGKFGELLILNDESSKLKALGIDKLVEHSSVEIGDGLGYDIRSYDKDGKELYIEVKTTTLDRVDGFYLTQNEINKAKLYRENFILYRVYSLNKKKGTYKVETFTFEELFDKFKFNPTQYLAEEK